ncbi:MAG: helix-turn-helix domain-containing protein [Actinomycetota bacterium]
MHLQTIPEAARTCGRSPREIRLMIEDGRLAAVRHGGRWLIEPLDLPGSQGPPVAPEPDRWERRAESEFLPGIHPRRHPVEPVPQPDTDRVLSLEAELREMRSQLDSARIRISELEASGFGRALRGSGERGALAPLFRPTTDA